MASSFHNELKGLLRSIGYLADQVDTVEAAARIKSNIWFRGPNVWILAFSIIIASVGLNVNSTAVIIGAMLISPLMGPIIGVGLALGTNDTETLRLSAVNLLVMVAISLLASSLYFLISPLELANPTELAARTHPTIYDVLIAFFGGLAGILENARKERGTVLSGVAIATALMPPLCTAGYGLANGNWQYFLGASFLFLINGIFIILATYLMVRVLGFRKVEFTDSKMAVRRKIVIWVVTLAIIVPSVLSAIQVVRENNFERNLKAFIADSKSFGRGYVYNYEIDGLTAELYLVGDGMNDDDTEELLAAAERHGIQRDQLSIKEHSFGSAREASERIIRSLNEKAESDIARKDAEIKLLERQIETLRGEDIPYAQVAREVKYQFPAVRDLTIARGAAVSTDSLRVRPCTQVLATTASALRRSEVTELENWLRIRLADTTVVVNNLVEKP